MATRKRDVVLSLHEPGEPIGRSCGGKHSAAARVLLAQRALAAAQQKYATQYAALKPNRPAPVPQVTKRPAVLERPSSAPSARRGMKPSTSRAPMLGEQILSVPQVHVQKLEEPPAPMLVNPPAPMGLMGHAEMQRELAAAREAAAPADEGGTEAADVEEKAPSATTGPIFTSFADARSLLHAASGIGTGGPPAMH